MIFFNIVSNNIICFSLWEITALTYMTIQKYITLDSKIIKCYVTEA